MVVDLVRYDGHPPASGDLQDALQVLLAEDGAAWVAGVVDDDGARARVDLGVQHLQVGLPAPLRLSGGKRSRSITTIVCSL